MTMEKRSAQDVKAEGRKLVGYAAVFGQRTTIGDFSEEIAPGAFARSLSANADILALVDHDPSKVLGRTKTGTLRLAEDGQGLRFEIDIPDTQLGRDLLTMAERGDVGGMSFGFIVPSGGDSWNGTHRTLTDISIYEISVVQAFPAYAGTTVDARSARTNLDMANRITLLELEGGAYGLV